MRATGMKVPSKALSKHAHLVMMTRTRRTRIKTMNFTPSITRSSPREERILRLRAMDRLLKKWRKRFQVLQRLEGTVRRKGEKQGQDQDNPSALLEMETLASMKITNKFPISTADMIQKRVVTKLRTNQSLKWQMSLTRLIQRISGEVSKNSMTRKWLMSLLKDQTQLMILMIIRRKDKPLEQKAKILTWGWSTNCHNSSNNNISHRLLSTTPTNFKIRPTCKKIHTKRWD